MQRFLFIFTFSTISSCPPPSDQPSIHSFVVSSDRTHENRRVASRRLVSSRQLIDDQNEARLSLTTQQRAAALITPLSLGGPPSLLTNYSVKSALISTGTLKRQSHMSLPCRSLSRWLGTVCKNQPAKLAHPSARLLSHASHSTTPPPPCS